MTLCRHSKLVKRVEPQMIRRRNKGESYRPKDKSAGKDIWDKLSSVSVLVTGGVVALFGIIATNAYNTRELEDQQDRTRQEVQMVEKLLPYLIDGDDQSRRLALTLVAALGDEELTSRLAEELGNDGVLAARTESRNGASVAFPSTWARQLLSEEDGVIAYDTDGQAQCWFTVYDSDVHISNSEFLNQYDENYVLELVRYQLEATPIGLLPFGPEPADLRKGRSLMGRLAQDMELNSASRAAPPKATSLPALRIGMGSD